MPEIDLNKKKVWNLNSVLTFGKYKDETVREVLNKDASILIWYDDNVEFFDLDDDVRQQAEGLKYQQRQQSRNTPHTTRGERYFDDPNLDDDDIPF